MSRLIIAIPAHNAGNFIKRTLQSVFHATKGMKDFRVIVSEDQSTDDTLEILQNTSFVKLEIYRHSCKLGFIENSNRCLALAGETDFLHMLHADDTIDPLFYHQMMTAMPPGRSLAYSQPVIVDSDDREIRRVRGKYRRISHRRFIADRSELAPIYISGCLMKTDHQPCPFKFRKSLPQVGDHVLWAEWATLCNRIVEMDPGLMRYTVHEKSWTAAYADDIQASVLDEWDVMTICASMLKEPGWKRKLRTIRQKAIFAARSRVKCVEAIRAASRITNFDAGMMIGNAAADRIREAAIKTVGWPLWLAGHVAATIKSSL